MKTKMVILIGFVLTLWSASVLALDPGESSLDDLTVEQKVELADALKRAKAAYDDGRFTESQQLYEKAYSILAKPSYIYGVALSLERAGHDREALEHYRLYATVAPPSERTGKLEKTIETLEERVAAGEKATLRILSVPADADVYTESTEAPIGRTPIEVELDPGTHRVGVCKDEYECRFELIELKPGGERQIEWKLAETEVTPPPKVEPEPEPERPKRRLSTGLLLATATSGVVTTATGIGWVVVDGRVADAASRNEAERRRAFANGLTVGFWTATAVTLGLATATLLKWRRNDETRIDVAVGPGGAALTLHSR